MATTNPQTPTVAVSVPVPTPVQQQPKQPQPVSFPAPAPPQPRQVMPRPVQAGGPQAIILPWTPPRKMGRLPRKVVKYMAANINVAQGGETAHQALTRLLGRGSRGDPHRRRLSNNAIVHRDPSTGDVHVRLHNTNVVTAHPDGSVTLNHGGYMTPTTRRYMGYANPAVRNVSFAGGKFMILTPEGKWQEYQNGTRFDPYAVASDPEQINRAATGHNNFVSRIYQDRTDTTAPLVYADWLDENGHSGMAEIVRKTTNEKDPHLYTIVPFNPAGWTGYAVNPDAPKGTPHAYYSNSITKNGTAGVGVMFPADPGNNLSGTFREEPHGFFTALPVREAHRVLSQMRDSGVANADHAVEQIEARHPQLVGRKYQRKKPCPSSQNRSPDTQVIGQRVSERSKPAGFPTRGRRALSGGRCNAKITEAQALEVIERVSSGHTRGSEATRLRVDPSTISRLVSGRRWKHLKGMVS